MQEIKMIVTDLDGTFLTDYDTLNEENIKAVKYAQDKGIIVCAVTARNWNMAKWIIRASGFERYAVINNGACIYDTQAEKPERADAIGQTELRQILEATIQHNTTADVFTSDYLVTYSPNSLWRSWRTEELLATMKEDERDDIRYCDTLDDMMALLQDDAEMVSIHSTDDGELPVGFFRDMVQMGELCLTSSHEGCLDITPFGCTKGQGVRKLAEMYGIGRENIMAFGDHYNDKGMLKWAGFGVAVGNANEKVQQVADHVTAKNSEAGVAQAIYRFI